MGFELDLGIIGDHIFVLLRGLLMTLQITSLSIALGGFGIGIAVALGGLSRNFILRSMTGAYVAFFRCTPTLVQIVWVFFVLPALLGISIPVFFSGMLALSLNAGAFFGETFRAGIQSVPREQYDAATALGLSAFQRFRYVVLPQAIRIVTPVLITLSVGLVRESSLVSTVGVVELMYTGNLLQSLYMRPVEILTTVALMYFCVTYPMTVIVRVIERKWQKREKR